MNGRLLSLATTTSDVVMNLLYLTAIALNTKSTLSITFHVLSFL